MDSKKSKISLTTTSSSSRRHSTRLLFDEWKDPSEEALAGGRGMFCILPLTKAFLNSASQSINVAANFAVKILERPDLFSPQALHTNLDKQLKNFLKKSDMSCSDLNGKYLAQTPTFTSQQPVETRESQIA
ncbi:hypothetical protein JCGZ_17217 [Jatropha curcas]|uniref:Uncharacterized protein n=1 Tax=Jatropha curcas TaxID=180498 RepID=A0A067LLH2_JATCU|nr:hypothetical protein JCGZ_17217 [Jatropha curcas]